MKTEEKNITPYFPYGLKGLLITDLRDDFYQEDYYEDHLFKKDAIWELCGYAPGDLNIYLGKGTFDGFLWRSESTYCCFYTGIKPILRPLSDLVHEIEHNGKKIVPFEEIAIIESPRIYNACDRIKNIFVFERGMSFNSRKMGVQYDYDHAVIDKITTMEITHYVGSIFHKNVIIGDDSWHFSQFTNYPLILEKLYEWHFDVFGLIEKGLAVDFNTLKNES